MKTATMLSILEGRVKEMEKYLARFRKDEKDMEKERHLAHIPEMMSMISHQIGYMTGAIEQTKEAIRMLRITDKQYFKREREVEEHNKRVFAMLKDVAKRAKHEA